VTQFSYVVRNLGAVSAGPFTARATLDPAVSVIVDQFFPSGLAAGAEQTVTGATPPSGNCFDPDCTISVTVDIGDRVKECDEGNNTASETTAG
jgi:subtilase family serine protease